MYPVRTFKVIIMSDITESVTEPTLRCCGTGQAVPTHRSLQKLTGLSKDHLQGYRNLYAHVETTSCMGEFQIHLGF